MIDKETFINAITLHEGANTYLDELSNLYINLYETPIVFALDGYLKEFTDSNFEEAGIGLIYWYLFERDDKSIFPNEYPIHNPDELWAEVLKYRK